MRFSSIRTIINYPRISNTAFLWAEKYKQHTEILLNLIDELEALGADKVLISNAEKKIDDYKMTIEELKKVYNLK